MIAGNPTALAAAFDQTHSNLYDLDEGAPSAKALVEYRTRPVDFLVEKLGIPRYRIVWSMNAGYADPNGVITHKWDGTPDPLVVMLDALADWKDCCVEAATGTQKSYTAACAVLWFLACWEGARAFTHAGSEEQLRSFMWKEIRELWPRFQAIFPSAILLDLRIRMRGGIDDSWGAIGVSVKKRAGEESAVGAQGMHAPHMLLVYEETPGIEYSVITAGENTCTAPHNLRLAVGNPDHQLDTLHQFGHDKAGKPRPNMECIRISALDHPNVVSKDPDIVPGAVSVKSVQSRLAARGEDDRMYKSRVRGVSPTEAKDALIQLEWVRRAQERWKDPETRRLLEMVGHGRRSLGVDVANSDSGDEASIAEGKGAVLEAVPSFPCPNANNLGFKVHLKMQEHGIDQGHVGVDSVGVGAGCVNELFRLQDFVQSLNGGLTGEALLAESGDEKYLNLRSKILWTMREDLRTDMIALPPDEELTTDLITATYKTANGKIVVESKEDIKKRMPAGRSPNKGDAACYWNYVRPRDPVTQSVGKPNPTVRERILRELQSLDSTPQKKKHYGTVLRQ
jgi:phage terminase large subunit